MPKTILQEAWTSQATFTSVLLTLLIDRFGTEALTWDPSTIAMEIEEDFDVEMSQVALDKLMVGIQLLTTDRFYKSLPDFITFCNVLDGGTYNPAMWDPADAEEVSWGITEAMLISPPEDDDEEPFSNEIRAYIGSALDSEGIINPPDILRIALRVARVSPSMEDFSDDPVMFNAIYDAESAKTADINKSVVMKTQLLAAQLGALQLENGQTKELAEMLHKASQKNST
jgi:hypothetical protein